MKKNLVLSVFLIFIFNANAQDSLTVNINKQQLKLGDTIVLDYNFTYENKLSSTSTLNLWIEDLDNHNTWKYRYPLINGTFTNSLIIGENIPEGSYAFNFTIQKYMFGFYGRVLNYNYKKSKGLNFMMLGKNNGIYTDNVLPDKDGYFITPRVIFEDTAKFIFSRIGDKYSDLYIDAITPLDSPFKSSIKKTIIINIGDTIIKNKNYTYNFDQISFGGNYTLSEVVVKSAKMKPIQEFDKEYSSFMFSSPFAKIIDGIESDEISKNSNLLNFLMLRIPGLKIIDEISDEAGWYFLKLRDKFPVDLYIDESKIENAGQLYINPSDVAMIKIIGPLQGGPLTLMTKEPHATVAIYSKRGNYEDNLRKYNFLVKGYTPSLIIWKK
jgi:hypothetical protein